MRLVESDGSLLPLRFSLSLTLPTQGFIDTHCSQIITMSQPTVVKTRNRRKNWDRWHVWGWDKHCVKKKNVVTLLFVFLRPWRLATSFIFWLHQKTECWDLAPLPMFSANLQTAKTGLRHKLLICWKQYGYTVYTAGMVMWLLKRFFSEEGQ